MMTSTSKILIDISHIIAVIKLVLNMLIRHVQMYSNHM